MKHREKVDALRALDRSEVRIRMVADSMRVPGEMDSLERKQLTKALSDLEDLHGLLLREVRDVRPKR